MTAFLWLHNIQRTCLKIAIAVCRNFSKISLYLEMKIQGIWMRPLHIMDLLMDFSTEILLFEHYSCFSNLGVTSFTAVQKRIKQNRYTYIHTCILTYVHIQLVSAHIFTSKY